MGSPPVTFGEFKFDPESTKLTRAGKRIAVNHRGSALLAALLKNPGSVCSKMDLMDAAWPGQSVEESNLSVQIAALRKVLGNADLIETVPRIGYRFSGDTDEIAPTNERIHKKLPLVAVIPWDTGRYAEGEDYFSDGIVDHLITALSRFNSFGVIARGSAFAYKGTDFDLVRIAGELGARFLLKVSVGRSANRLRIITQLYEGQSGRQLWAEQFDGVLEDIFEFQDCITPAVASIIEPQIQKAELERSKQKPAGSVSVYDLYLQARALILDETEQGNARAFELLTRALAIEPENGLVLSHASWVLEHRHTMGWLPIGSDDIECCRKLARRGISNAEDDATVLSICGMSLLQAAREYEFGLAVIQSAVELNPNNVVANVHAGVAHLHCGDLDASEMFLQKAILLSPRDPHSHIPLCTMAHLLILRGEYAQALTWATRALAKNPHFDPTYWMLIAANVHLGQIEEARAHLKRLLEISPGVTVATISGGQPGKDPTRFDPISGGLSMAGLQ